MHSRHQPRSHHTKRTPAPAKAASPPNDSKATTSSPSLLARFNSWFSAFSCTSAQSTDVSEPAATQPEDAPTASSTALINSPDNEAVLGSDLRSEFSYQHMLPPGTDIDGAGRPKSATLNAPLKSILKKPKSAEALAAPSSGQSVASVSPSISFVDVNTRGTSPGSVVGITAPPVTLLSQRPLPVLPGAVDPSAVPPLPFGSLQPVRQFREARRIQSDLISRPAPVLMHTYSMPSISPLATVAPLARALPPVATPSPPSSSVRHSRTLTNEEADFLLAVQLSQAELYSQHSSPSSSGVSTARTTPASSVVSSPATSFYTSSSVARQSSASLPSPFAPSLSFYEAPVRDVALEMGLRASLADDPKARQRMDIRERINLSRAMVASVGDTQTFAL